MSRQNRAKQFAPFEALKGLQDALRLKEYEHDRVQKGDISEEKTIEISRTLLSLEKKDQVFLIYFEDGHEKHEQGEVKMKLEEGVLQINGKKISLENVLDLKKVR